MCVRLRQARARHVLARGALSGFFPVPCRTPLSIPPSYGFGRSKQSYSDLCLMTGATQGPSRLGLVCTVWLLTSARPVALVQLRWNSDRIARPRW